MTKLEELIKELCPNGVEFRKVSDILCRQSGTVITAGQMKKLNKLNAPIRVFAAGNTFADVDYCDIPDKDIIVKPSIIVKSRGNIGFEYYDKPFTHKNELWSYSVKDGNVCLKYIYYYLQNHVAEFQVKAKSGKLPQISIGDTDSYQIPLPPLAVQREIVRILDKFTLYSQELAAELAARRAQYNYYRDKLLSFNNTIEYFQLGDIAMVTKLAGFEFTNYVHYSAQGNIIALRGLNVKNGQLDLNDVKYIDGSDLSKLGRSKLVIGDMLFTYVGTIGQVALIDENDKYYLAPNVALIRLNDKIAIKPKYLQYYFQTSQFYNTQILRLLQSSSMQNIPMEKIRKFKIAVPSLEVQERIVNALDNFDAICSDLGIGLPAEIEKRQQQYEFYRDKLLTFGTSSATILTDRQTDRAD